MAVSRWRTEPKKVIERAIRDMPYGTDRAALRKLISNAYPFGDRALHPYKIWLDETRKQLDRRFPKPKEPLPKNWWDGIPLFRKNEE